MQKNIGSIFVNWSVKIGTHRIHQSAACSTINPKMASQQWMNTCSVISDHLIQFFIEPKSSCKTTSNVKKEVICYKNFNQQAFKSSLDKVNWGRVLNTNDPNSNLEHFFDIINALWDKHTPYQNVTKNYI